MADEPPEVREVAADLTILQAELLIDGIPIAAGSLTFRRPGAPPSPLMPSSFTIRGEISNPFWTRRGMRWLKRR